MTVFDLMKMIESSVGCIEILAYKCIRVSVVIEPLEPLQ